MENVPSEMIGKEPCQILLIELRVIDYCLLWIKTD